MKHITPLFAFCFILCTVTSIAAQEEKSMVVLDVSGSMWGQIDGVTKIEIARDAIKEMVTQWPDSREVGLVAYGHRFKGDCNDIETVLPISTLNRAELAKKVDSLVPRGKTPLTASVKHAAEELKYTENKATVILISDGIETCDLDPCKVGAELEKLGVDFTAHVVGFDVNSIEDQKGLKCLAENTGGRFIAAANAAQLNEALIETAKVVVEDVPPAAEVKVLPKAEIAAPESAVKGTEITFQVLSEDKLEAWLYLFPAEGDKSVAYAAIRADESGGYEPGKLRLPAKVGDYFLRIKTTEDKIIAEKAINIIEAEVKIDSPNEVSAATEIEFSLTAPSGLDGYVYIYPAGKDKSLGYERVAEDGSGGYANGKIQVPAQVGEYTLKWKSGSGEVLAEKNFKVIESKITIDAPEKAAAGTEVTFSLSGPDGLGGYIYLYPAGKDKSLTYEPVQADQYGGYKQGRIRMPVKKGSYDIKWKGNYEAVIAETSIEVTEITATIESVEEAPIATKLKVTVSAPDGLSGYIHLHAVGKEKSITYASIREQPIGGYTPMFIQLPAKTGDYELRWKTTSNEIIATKTFKVVGADVSFTAPSQVTKDQSFIVIISAPAGISGDIYLFKKDSDRHITYRSIREGRIDNYDPINFNAPKETGEYMLRWISNDKQILSERELTVIESSDAQATD